MCGDPKDPQLQADCKILISRELKNDNSISKCIAKCARRVLSRLKIKSHHAEYSSLRRKRSRNTSLPNNSNQNTSRRNHYNPIYRNAPTLIKNVLKSIEIRVLFYTFKR